MTVVVSTGTQFRTKDIFSFSFFSTPLLHERPLRSLRYNMRAAVLPTLLLATATITEGADPAGYTCAANKNYEGEKTCFSNACPDTGIGSEAACAKKCDNHSGCTVFVYNNKQECYLKSDYTTATDDDPANDTVSCAKGGPAPAPPGPTPAAGTLVPASDGHVQYIGRFDTKNPARPEFSWSAAQVALTFSGSSTLRANFTAPGPGMRVLPVVDGVAGDPIMWGADKGDDDDDGEHGKLTASHVVASGLDASAPHTVALWKVTEDTAGSDGKRRVNGNAYFHGFGLDAGAKLLTPPARPARRLEFIGDSDTAGWCADGTPKQGTDTAHKFQNAHDTWAAQLAAALNAEMFVEAISGWGVGAGASAIQQNLPNTCNFDASSSWDYTRWVPDAVVMLIGPNDESFLARRFGGGQAAASGSGSNGTAASYGGANFIKQYTNLLDYVAGAYAAAPAAPKIISVCGGSLNGLDPCEDIQTAQAAFNKKQSKVVASYVSITKAHWKEINGPDGKGKSEYNGCDGHCESSLTGPPPRRHAALLPLLLALILPRRLFDRGILRRLCADRQSQRPRGAHGRHPSRRQGDHGLEVSKLCTLNYDERQVK